MSWPIHLFNELVNDETGGNVKTLQSEFLSSGKFPIIDQGQDFIAGFTDDEERVCRSELPVIIFGDHTKSFKYIDFPFCLGADGTKVLRPQAGVHPKYLYHYLRQTKFPDAGYSRHFKYLREVRIPLPPPAEQKRIASILDAADALRAKRRAAFSKVDQLGQSIFLEMFGDPATNPMKWPVVTIGDLLESATYGISEKAEPEGTLPILRMNNITRYGRLNLDDLKFINLIGEDINRYIVQDGDILFNRTNSPELVGKTAVFRIKNKMAYAGYLIRLRVNSDAFPEYISSFLNSRYGKLTLRKMCKTIIGMSNINATEVQGIKIPKPPVGLQERFFERLSGIEKTRLTLEESSAKLSALFVSIQHRAFKGDL